MLWQLGRIFLDIITPVFAIVLIGYLAGPRLGLEARTLSRFAYYIPVPAFVFHVMSTAKVESGLAIRMVIFMLAVQAGCTLLGFLTARLLRRPAEMVGAYVLIAVFGNVGNFGLPIIEFRLGPEALLPATVYFLVISTSAFVIGVAAAGWSGQGQRGALLSVLKTPALLALPPALLINGTDLELPLFLSRIVSLLADAMIPVMLITLGVQLGEVRQIRLSRDTVIASGLRLLGGAALALLLVPLFQLDRLERGAGILQAGMPAAVLTSIIALEYDMAPEFVTTTVLFSTLASTVTLTLLLALV